MKPRARQFEKKLRSATRREVKADPRLKKEYRRQRSANRSVDTPVSRIILFVVGAAAAIAWSHEADSLLRFPLAIAGLYATGTIFTRANALLVRLFASTEMTAALYYPVPEEAVWRWAMTQTLKGVAVVAVIFFALYSYSAWDAGALTLTAAAAFSFIQGLGLFSAIVAAAVVVRGRFGMALALPFYGVAACMIWGNPGLRGLAFEMTRLLPARMVTGAYDGLRDGQWPSLWYVFPMVAIAASLPVWIKKLRSHFSMDQVEIAPTGNPGDPEETDAAEAGELDASMQAVRDEFRAGKAEQAIADRGAPDQGWVPGTAGIEAIVTRFTSEREKVLLYFLLGGKAGWTQRWKLGLKIAVVGAIALLAMPRFLPQFQFVAYIIAAVGCIVGMPMLGGEWLGYRGGFASMRQSPFYAIYPFRFRDLSKVVLKSNLVRTVAFLPIFIVLSAIVGWVDGNDSFFGLEFGLKIAWLLLCLQLFMSANKHLLQSSDFRDMNRHTFPFLTLFILIGLPAYIGATILLFFYSVVGGAVAVLALSVAYWLALGWLHDRGRLDLIKIPDQGPQVSF